MSAMAERHWFTYSPQQHMQPPIPEARRLPRQLHQPAFLAVRHSARSRIGNWILPLSAGRTPPLAEGIVLLYLPDSCLRATSLNRSYGSLLR